MRALHSTCRRPGCTKRPTYGVKGSRKRELCVQHALPGMINVDVARCCYSGCNSRATFSFPDKSVPAPVPRRKGGATRTAVVVPKKEEFCVSHSLPGMVLSRGKGCVHHNCVKRASYGVVGTRNREFCARHAKDGMVNINGIKMPPKAVDVKASGDGGGNSNGHDDHPLIRRTRSRSNSSSSSSSSTGSSGSSFSGSSGVTIVVDTSDKQLVMPVGANREHLNHAIHGGGRGDDSGRGGRYGDRGAPSGARSCLDLGRHTTSAVTKTPSHLLPDEPRRCSPRDSISGQAGGGQAENNQSVRRMLLGAGSTSAPGSPAVSSSPNSAVPVVAAAREHDGERSRLVGAASPPSDRGVSSSKRILLSGRGGGIICDPTRGHIGCSATQHRTTQQQQQQETVMTNTVGMIAAGPAQWWQTSPFSPLPRLPSISALSSSSPLDGNKKTARLPEQYGEPAATTRSAVEAVRAPGTAEAITPSPQKKMKLAQELRSTATGKVRGNGEAGLATGGTTLTKPKYPRVMLPWPMKLAPLLQTHGGWTKWEWKPVVLH